MSRLIRKTEVINDSFGVKVDHEKLINRGVIEVYRVSFKKSAYIDDVVTIDDLRKMKHNIDEVIRICEIIKLQEEKLKEFDFNEVKE